MSFNALTSVFAAASRLASSLHPSHGTDKVGFTGVTTMSTASFFSELDSADDFFSFLALDDFALVVLVSGEDSLDPSDSEDALALASVLALTLASVS